MCPSRCPTIPEVIIGHVRWNSCCPFPCRSFVATKTFSSRLKTGSWSGNGGDWVARRTGSLVQLSERGSVRHLLDQSLRLLSSLLHGVWATSPAVASGHTAASSAHFTLAKINQCQCPATNWFNLATNLSLPNNPPRRGRCNIILGKSRNNFHPRSCWSTFLLDAPATISRAILRQIRNDPHKNRGTDPNKQPRCLNLIQLSESFSHHSG